jgi:hypothetical protein
MPGGDGTGPMGMGPMTGRAAGYCAGYAVPGYVNPVGGRGYPGWGRGGGGRGRRNWFRATGMPGFVRFGAGVPPTYGAGVYPGVAAAPSRELQIKTLTEQARFLEQQLEEIRAAVAELETESDD